MMEEQEIQISYRAPNPQDTAMHSKNIKKSKLIPLAAYSSNSWNT